MDDIQQLDTPYGQRDLSAALCEALCHILGNTCRISRTAASYHWNATGAGAYLAAQCFKKQSAELHNSLDMLAIHIRTMGNFAILDYSDAVVEINPPIASAVPKIDRMMQNLSEGHKQACLSISAGIDIAKEAEDEPTVRILAERLAVHRQHMFEIQLLAGQSAPS